MYKIRDYVVFYMKFDLIGRKDDLLSLGISSAAIDAESGLLKQLVDQFAQLLADRDRVLHEVPSYKDGIGDAGICTSHFGPVLMLYCPNRNNETIKSVYALAAIHLPHILRKMGTRGRFVRGAFLTGWGWEISECGLNTLYGPVMQSAWEMLTTRAYSPRIIIEETIFKVISDRKSYGPGLNGDWLPLYAKRDYDGQGVFNYLVYDLQSYSVKADTVNGIVSDLKRTLRVLGWIVKKFSDNAFVHDSSISVRMLMAHIDYVVDAMCQWTGVHRASVMNSTLSYWESTAH